MATAQIQIPDDLAPGFRVMPGGNLGYSVAEDYPKQMAQIAASLDTLATNRATRTTPLSEVQLDAIENDLLNRRQMFPSWSNRAIASAIPRAQTVKAGSDVYQLTRDASGNLVPSKIIETPEKITERRYPGPTAIDLLGSPTTQGSYTLNEWASLAPMLSDEVRTNAPVAAYLDWAKQATQPAATNAPVAIAPMATPRMAIGGFDTPLAPIGNPMGTNAPAPNRVRTKSGRTYDILSY